MKKYKHNLVYKTTNILNNKFYIGVHSTDKINDGYLGSGIVILEAIKKYGKENFKKEIIFDCKSREEAFKKEKELVDESVINSTMCYNCCEGGQIPPSREGTVHSEYTKKNMSKNRKGKNNSFYGKKHSEKTKNHLSKVKSGSNHYMFNKTYKEIYGEEKSKKILENRSKNFSGENNPMYGIQGESHPRYGKKHTKKTKEKISKTLKGTSWEDIHGKKKSKKLKKKMSTRCSGKNNPRSRKLKHIPTGKIFECGKDACEWAGIKYNTLMGRIYRNSSNNEFKFI